jgi:hypothetical protein
MGRGKGETMKYVKLVEDQNKMDQHFHNRTNEHIARVQKYAQKIADYKPELAAIVDQASTHDASKFEAPEIEPYKHISWQYEMKRQGGEYNPPEDISTQMNLATQHHVTSNRHHPEYHQEQKTDLINREDRDKPPAEMIDGTKMNDIDIAEMVADWSSMSEELNSETKDWADNNVNVRWKFTDEQKALIYELIDNIEVDR